LLPQMLASGFTLLVDEPGREVVYGKRARCCCRDYNGHKLWKGAFEMIQVGIAELKARLSEYLSRVEDGEEIVVADRGRPVARLVPPVWKSGGEEDSRMLDLQRRGLVRIGSGVLPDDIWQMERPQDKEGSVRAALEAERAESH
jgi:prevent-host-death family protein